MIRLRIHYYGEIEEKTGKASEFLEINTPYTDHIVSYIKNKYHLEVDGIQIAVNQNIITQPTRVNKEDEIAILSPFAGG